MFVVAVVIYDLKHVVSKHSEPGPSMSDQGVSMDLAEFGQYVPREHDDEEIVRVYYENEGRSAMRREIHRVCGSPFGEGEEWDEDLLVVFREDQQREVEKGTITIYDDAVDPRVMTHPTLHRTVSEHRAISEMEKEAQKRRTKSVSLETDPRRPFKLSRC